MKELCFPSLRRRSCRSQRTGGVGDPVGEGEVPHQVGGEVGEAELRGVTHERLMPRDARRGREEGEGRHDNMLCKDGDGDSRTWQR